jgi:hypothetical protein
MICGLNGIIYSEQHETTPRKIHVGFGTPHPRSFIHWPTMYSKTSVVELIIQKKKMTFFVSVIPLVRFVEMNNGERTTESWKEMRVSMRDWIERFFGDRVANESRKSFWVIGSPEDDYVLGYRQ